MAQCRRLINYRNMEGKTIKSHEARLVIEYDKLYRFGIQKKSDNY